jgi:bifunctional non-homologous end joining protein LigD
MVKWSRWMRRAGLSFQLLQAFESSEQRVPLVYYAFDLLFLEGKDLRREPLSARRQLLAGVPQKIAPAIIRLSDELRSIKDELLRVAQQFGLEGLVVKKPNPVYESGRRSSSWVKYKITKSQEFVIDGYTLPEGWRKYFGPLLVGYHSPDGPMFAGRVSTSFSDKVLANLYTKFQILKAPSCPFVNLPENYAGGNETSPMSQPRACRPDQAYRVDQRRPASATRSSDCELKAKDLVREMVDSNLRF